MSDLVVRHDDLVDLKELATAMVESRFFKDVTKAAEAVVKILAGREVGLGPVESMRSFHAINGKVEWTAEALAARVKGSERYDYTVVELTNEACELIFWQDGEECGPSRFDEADRALAGLQIADRNGEPTAWSKYPRNMMFSRALTNGVGWYCPDVALGLAAREAEIASEVRSTIDQGDVPELSEPVIVSSEEAGPDIVRHNGEGLASSASEEADPPGSSSGAPVAAAPAADGNPTGELADVRAAEAKDGSEPETGVGEAGGSGPSAATAPECAHEWLPSPTSHALVFCSKCGAGERRVRVEA